VVTLHVILATAAIIGAFTVVGVGAWSVVAGRRSGGRRDNRSALDRAVLAVLASVVVAEMVGVALLLTGARPADPLHFLYGPAALIALPIAIWFGARTPSADASRVRRDLWTVVGAIVLLGILFRLFATG
jgi:hypothetical protein